MARLYTSISFVINPGISSITYGVGYEKTSIQFANVVDSSRIIKITVPLPTVPPFYFGYYVTPKPGYELDTGVPESKSGALFINIASKTDSVTTIAPTAHSTVSELYWYNFVDPVGGVKYIDIKIGDEWVSKFDFSSPFQANGNSLSWYAVPKVDFELKSGMPYDSATALEVFGTISKEKVKTVVIETTPKAGNSKAGSFVTYDKNKIDEILSLSEEELQVLKTYIDTVITNKQDDIIRNALNEEY